MANGTPSPGAAQRMAAGAADLDALRGVPAEKHEQAIAAVLKQHGMLCEGCGRAIEIGIHFYRFETRMEQGKVLVSARRVAACSRDDCGFAELAREGAHVMEMREFAWLDELGAPPPAAADERDRRAAE